MKNLKNQIIILKKAIIFAVAYLVLFASCSKNFPEIQAELDLPPIPPPTYYGSSSKYLVDNPEYLKIKKFDSLGFPENLPKEKIRELLQKFSDKVYLIGFQHFGDPDDANHGHILLSADHRNALIILYHTQEFPGSGYQFNTSARSWIQWIENGEVKNAYQCVRKKYPETPAWQAWKEKFLEASYATGSVSFEMLDPDILGFEIPYVDNDPYTYIKVKNEFHFSFTKVKCGKFPENSNIIAMKNKNERTCLIINVGAF